MSGDVRSLSWAVATADYEHWTAEQRAAAEADPDTRLYSDYAVGLVAEAMRAAGQAVMDAHPEMFRGELI